MIKNCRAREGLGVNSSKTALVPFTRRRKYQPEDTTLNGTQLTLSKEAYYLSVIIDQKLTWDSHIIIVIFKAIAAT